jgi:hypothetical protein
MAVGDELAAADVEVASAVVGMAATVGAAAGVFEEILTLG